MVIQNANVEGEVDNTAQSGTHAEFPHQTAQGRDTAPVANTVRQASSPAPTQSSIMTTVPTATNASPDIEVVVI